MLRQPTLDDARAIFETYAQDTEVTRFLTWRPHSTIGETRDFLQSRLDAWRKQSGFTWAITLLDQKLIGAIALRVRDFKADAGYVIARPFWNQGYATEALQAIVDWALAQPQIHRVWAVCDVDNRASARVLEKVGMAREGVLRRWIMHPNISDKPRDCLCYAIVKSQNWAPTSEPMNDFEHVEGGIELLDSVAPLWEQQKAKARHVKLFFISSCPAW